MCPIRQTAVRISEITIHILNISSGRQNLLLNIIVVHLNNNGKIYPVEIKKNADSGEGAVLCMSSMVIPLDTYNRIVPIKCI